MHNGTHICNLEIQLKELQDFAVIFAKNQIKKHLKKYSLDQIFHFHIDKILSSKNNRTAMNNFKLDTKSLLKYRRANKMLRKLKKSLLIKSLKKKIHQIK